MKDKKFLYCPQCKQYPDVIREVYEPKSLVEVRRWDGIDYALEDSSIDDIPFSRVCGKCGVEVEEREA